MLELNYTLEQAKQDYRSGKSQYRYAIVRVGSLFPLELGKTPFPSEECEHLYKLSYYSNGKVYHYKQVDFLEEIVNDAVIDIKKYFYENRPDLEIPR